MHLLLKNLHGAHRASLSHFSYLIDQCLAFRCVHCAKTIHAHVVKLGLNSKTFLGNRCLQLYALFGSAHDVLKVFDGIKEKNIVSWNICLKGLFRFGDVKGARHLFDEMPERDIVSWNSMISGCVSLGFADNAMDVFLEMQKAGFRPIHCINSDQCLLLPPRAGTGLKDAVQLFEETNQWDQALCHVMISSFAWHGQWRDSMWLFVYALRKNLRPTEITFSSVLSSISVFTPLELGSQIHNLVLKLGFESDAIVASSLVDMYAKVGSIGNAMKVFTDMPSKDLISWNTMIMGLVKNGKYFEAVQTFKKLVRAGLPAADRITLTGVLLACSHAGFVDEGLAIFSTMENEHRVVPRSEHYACAVDLLSRAGKFEEAVNIIKRTTCQPSSTFWKSLLDACEVHGDLDVIERVAERVMKLEPQSSLPYYSVLARAYAMRGRWESMVRVSKAMENIAAQKVNACSWVLIKDCVYAFEDDQLQLLRRENFIAVLELIIWEVEYGNDIDDLLDEKR